MRKKELKNWCRVAFAILSLVWFMTGCEKAPVNSTIEGHWKLQEFVIAETQERVKCEHLYLGISHEVTLLSEKSETENLGSFVARTRFIDNESTLEFSDFKVRGATSDSKVDATVEQLLPFGIDNPQKTVFHIIQSSHDELIMESDYARLFMRRF